MTAQASASQRECELNPNADDSDSIFPSTNDGIVKKILVNDGQPVEFGQPLIVLK